MVLASVIFTAAGRCEIPLHSSVPSSVIDSSTDSLWATSES